MLEDKNFSLELSQLRSRAFNRSTRSRAIEFSKRASMVLDDPRPAHSTASGPNELIEGRLGGGGYPLPDLVRKGGGDGTGSAGAY